MRELYIYIQTYTQKKQILNNYYSHLLHPTTLSFFFPLIYFPIIFNYYYYFLNFIILLFVRF